SRCPGRRSRRGRNSSSAMSARARRASVCRSWSSWQVSRHKKARSSTRAGGGLMGRADGLRRRSEELQLDGDAGHQGEQDAGGDQPHGGLDGRLFREAEAREQRAKIADVLGGILTMEADLMQGAPRACFGCANQERFKLSLGHTEVIAGFGW